MNPLTLFLSIFLIAIILFLINITISQIVNYLHLKRYHASIDGKGLSPRRYKIWTIPKGEAHHHLSLESSTFFKYPQIELDLDTIQEDGHNDQKGFGWMWPFPVDDILNRYFHHHNDEMAIHATNINDRSCFISQLEDWPLRIFVGTWNLGNTPLSLSNLTQWLQSASMKSNPNGYCCESTTNQNIQASSACFDLFVLGFQECCYQFDLSSRKTCGQELLDITKKVLGDDFQLIRMLSIRDSIRSLIFIRQQFISCITNIVSKVYSTTIPVFWRKGAIGIAFDFLGTRLAFIHCHLYPHSSGWQVRNRELEQIFQSLHLNTSPTTQPSLHYQNQSQSSNTIHQFHHLWVYGDLNYRIMEEKSQCVFDFLHSSRFISSNLQIKEWIASLQIYDQLKYNQNQCLALHGFYESQIKFLPTYKLKRSKDKSSSSQLISKRKEMERDEWTTYDERRVPGWCDRILVHSLPDAPKLNYRSYQSADDIKSASDHIPVYATFDCTISALGMHMDITNNILLKGQDERDTHLDIINHCPLEHWILTFNALEISFHINYFDSMKINHSKWFKVTPWLPSVINRDLNDTILYRIILRSPIIDPQINLIANKSWKWQPSILQSNRIASSLSVDWQQNQEATKISFEGKSKIETIVACQQLLKSEYLYFDIEAMRERSESDQWIPSMERQERTGGGNYHVVNKEFQEGSKVKREDNKLIATGVLSMKQVFNMMTRSQFKDDRERNHPFEMDLSLAGLHRGILRGIIQVIGTSRR